ncbi:hypothetical protein HJFPF1_04129 [Paramyrothecium foliicola]|nr:hypothetical protein HJFPF1_04129 [Paramyrothecium foliicola]
MRKSVNLLYLCFAGMMPAGVLSNTMERKIEPSSPCAFSLSASEPFGGSLWQFPDGQIRLNGSYEKATFWIDKDGGIKDTRGFGQILTSFTDFPAAQIRCAQRRKPLKGFSIDAEKNLSYKGTSKFFACPGLYDEYGLSFKAYLNPEKCLPITLKASDCGNPCPAASTVWETCFSTTTTTATYTNTEVITTQDCTGGSSFTTSWLSVSNTPNISIHTPIM